MNTCGRFETQLAAFAHGDLTVAQARQISAHMEQCEPCRKAVARYRHLADNMRKLPEMPVPEHVLHGFSQEIMERISTPAPSRVAHWHDWLVPLFLPRWRFAMAALATAALVFALVIWQTQVQSTSGPALKLAQLLQTRAWDKLYYGLLEKESRAFLLHESVPAGLIKTALVELFRQGERDKRLRMGLAQIFIAVAGREPKLQESYTSAKILGVISARGYRLVPRKPGREHDPDVLLRAVQDLPPDTDVTLADLVKSDK